MKKIVASWSGGKDSTFMVDEMLRRGDQLDEVIFCDTGFEFPQMYEYIKLCKDYWERKYDIKITLLNWGSGKDIWERWAEGKYTKGEMEGEYRGWPFAIGMSWCTRELKVKPFDDYIKSNYSGTDVFVCIGLAINEPKRVPVDWKNNLYPMVSWGITESQAGDALKERGLFNPLYNHFNRTGCYLCPKQSLKSLNILKLNYPELWSEMKSIDDKYDALGSNSGYKIIGIDEIELKLSRVDTTSDMFAIEEPLGCFCK